MDTKLSETSRTQFRDRLAEALQNAGVPLSPTAVAREYNLRSDGANVSTHAVRKWLVGEAYPTQERLLNLAKWLAVSPQWLRFGDGANDREQSTERGFIPHDQVILLSDFRRLDEQSQAVIKDMVASMLRHRSPRI